MNDSRKVIGIDFDDILFDFMGPLISWHNDTYGTQISRDDYYSYDFSEVWKCSGQDAIARVGDFYHSEQYKTAEPIPGALQGLEKLKDDYKFIIITARPDYLERVTKEWLEIHFTGLFDEIVFTNHYHGTGAKRLKSEICLELGVSLFIEDGLHNAIDISDAGIPVLLLDTPWNRKDAPPLITRVYSWNEIVEKIKNTQL